MAVDRTEAGEERALSERLADEIHRRIISGEIPRGTRLRQDAVAAEFGVSRTPVREAFRALHGQGVIDITPRRGALVHGPTPRDIRENYEVRAELEGFGAELATDHIDDQQLDELREAASRFQALAAEVDGDDEERGKAWVEANDRFHRVLLEAADNSHLIASVEELHRRIPHNITFTALIGDSRRLQENADAHVAIASAVGQHKGRDARRLMRAHLLRASELISRRLERELVD